MPMNENDRTEQHLGETKGIRNHDHDVVHELSIRLDSVWRYDQYIANAQSENAPSIKALWEEVKEQDVKIIDRLKGLIREHVEKGDF